MSTSLDSAEGTITALDSADSRKIQIFQTRRIHHKFLFSSDGPISLVTFQSIRFSLVKLKNILTNNSSNSSLFVPKFMRISPISGFFSDNLGLKIFNYYHLR